MDKLSNVFFLPLLLFALSCEKKLTAPDETVFIGKVVDSETSQPVEGASFMKVDKCPYTVMNDTTFIAQTDKDGNYQFSQRIVAKDNPFESCSSYYIVKHKGYIGGGLLYRIGAVNEADLQLVKVSYLKVHIKNTSNNSDWFTMTIDQNASFPYSWSFNSVNLDTTFTTVIYPNYSHDINWKATLFTTITASGNEKPYFTSGDTIYRDIFF